ncbi:glucan biosynthesis protein [Haloferula sargassicola]|uniref:glucan biosynthesis protein n=1 Tax=Haloferula sargassicola TaxID=490096 RepID=UPI0033653975
MAAFGLADVEARAKELAAEPYAQPRLEEALPKPLLDLTYDQYRAIKHSPDGRLWDDGETPFRVEMFHPGYLFKRPVIAHEVSSDLSQVKPLPFDPARFDYTSLVLEDEVDWSSLPGYAGFRIQFPLNGGADQWDEIGSFLGASYFRILGQDQRYGISARALALNVAHPEALEEFPEFVEHWLVKPAPGDRELRFFSLLDSPSVTGAFAFRLVPGVSTEMDVTASLFFRKEVKSLGLAPLTSMFLFGENSRERCFHDWRPEVHDSDGLLVAASNGELIWRPLVNQTIIRYSAFAVDEPRGFGLLQRDREFRNYQDLDNPYQFTPSYWVEAREGMGPGAVRLVELPTKYESYDNVVAFFEPSGPVPVGNGEPLRYSYILKSKMHLEESLSPERAVATYVGVDPFFNDTRRFAIDFNGPTLQGLDRHSQVFAEITSSTNGFVTENRCFKNEHTGGWRVAFKLDTDDHNTDPVELRCFLKLLPEGRTLTETWSYLWHPEV